MIRRYNEKIAAVEIKWGEVGKAGASFPFYALGYFFGLLWWVVEFFVASVWVGIKDGSGRQ